MKKKNQDENVKKFSDFTTKSWIKDNGKIIVGDNAAKIMAGQSTKIDVKEILYGDLYPSWQIAISIDDKIILLKSSRELK